MSEAEAIAELRANSGRQLARDVEGEIYFRYPLRTHFVEVGEDYLELIKSYALPYYQQGDILSISEKIITLCQGNVMYKDDVKISLLAKVLSRFVMKTPHGQSVGNVYKMQAAINICGWWRVLFAAIASAIGKLFGKRGVFYRIVGHGVSNIDGFNAFEWDYYADKGLLGPVEPDKVCDEIKEEFNIDCMIVDANDLGVEIMGKSKSLNYADSFLKALIQDNPAGQGKEMTPFILIRKQTEDSPIT